jgi:hypothetical protein
MIAAAVVLAAPAPALAAPWTVQPTPNPPRTAFSGLVAVSCGADASCLAVGTSTTAAGAGHALAERWNGSIWTIQAPAVPAGWRQTALAGVSCVSANQCTAVGSGVDRTGKRLTLAEHWNGTRWTVQPTPNPSLALPVHELTAASCTSATACVAVGTFGKERFSPIYTATFSGLIERWNGRRWSVQHVIRAPSGTTKSLDGVSCASGSACVAVGSSTASGPGGPLAVRWNGHRWSNLNPPNHAGSTDLVGVSCVSATWCTAVGEFFVSRDRNAIAERWRGGHWTVTTPPRPIDAGAALLSGVSCRSPSICVAVGSTGPADPTGGLAEDWDGLHWTIRPTPGGDGWPLSQVACRPAFCLAVGSHDTATLAERYR